MSFARWVFRISSLYGLIVLLPQFFIEEFIFRNNPPPLTHPEYFYGFLGVAVAWQVAFLVIAQDPARFRGFMIPAFLEKISFASATIVLFMKDRVSGTVLEFGLLDLVLGVLFAIAFRRLPAKDTPAS